MERLTRIKSIRKKCLDCGDGVNDVRECAFSDCSLYDFRLGHRPKSGITASEAIKKFCLECCNGSVTERRLCTAVKCPVWRYRKGKEEFYSEKNA